MARDGDDPTKWTFSVGKRQGLHMIEVVETGAEDKDGKKLGPCWIWKGTTASGYGVLTYPTKRFPTLKIGRRKDHRKGWRAIGAHQLFYFMKYGNPPAETELGHICSRRSCCNPDHVRPISQLQNAAEMYQMPALSPLEYEAVEEMIMDDVPLRQISDLLCISVWSIRKIAREVGQLTLAFDPEVPF
jgi:DNA-binding CsgD family transcriptional regulator